MTPDEKQAEWLIEQLNINAELKPQLVEICSKNDPSAIEEYLLSLAMQHLQAVSDDHKQVWIQGTHD